MNTRNLLSCLLVAVLSFPISGGAATVGQQFRDIMAEIDAQCRKDKQGPYFEPGIPNHDRHSGCDILSIKPADPLATEEGRFAYSIKLPEPHDKLKAEYRFGMGAEGYFKELCEKDAGEWIFRTVEGVEGVFQGRRMEPYPAAYSDLIFHTRELSEIRSVEPELRLVQPNSGRFNFFEILSTTDKKQAGNYSRFYRGEVNTSRFGGSFQTNRKNGGMVRVPYILHEEETNTLDSRYSYTWRQVSNSDMLENGIAGGESVIFDRATGEVLAFRRFFIRMWPQSDSRYTRMVNGEQCHPGFSGELFDFIEKVLVPIELKGSASHYFRSHHATSPSH